MTFDRRNQTIQLSDGRQLGFAEYGAPKGKPIFFFPGGPSTRLFHHPDESIATSLGARIINIDRPGYGLSSFQPQRTLFDWPDDVLELADALELETFSIAGISAGGPYVAVCAYKIPERVFNATIISGVGLTDIEADTQKLYRKRQIAITLARKAPWLLRPLIWLLQNPRRDPERYFVRTFAESSPPDQAILSQPEIKNILIPNWAEGVRQGVRGFAREGIILAHPWGVPLEEIAVPVFIWHGDNDASIPLSMAEQIHHAIPSSKLHVIPNEGHFLLFKYWHQILNEILQGVNGDSNEP
jgi:pimeloyl-ACP methyl ester carboxylesterase